MHLGGRRKQHDIEENRSSSEDEDPSAKSKEATLGLKDLLRTIASSPRLSLLSLFAFVSFSLVLFTIAHLDSQPSPSSRVSVSVDLDTTTEDGHEPQVEGAREDDDIEFVEGVACDPMLTLVFPQHRFDVRVPINGENYFTMLQLGSDLELHIHTFSSDGYRANCHISDDDKMTADLVGIHAAFRTTLSLDSPGMYSLKIHMPVSGTFHLTAQSVNKDEESDSVAQTGILREPYQIEVVPDLEAETRQQSSGNSLKSSLINRSSNQNHHPFFLKSDESTPRTAMHCSGDNVDTRWCEFKDMCYYDGNFYFIFPDENRALARLPSPLLMTGTRRRPQGPYGDRWDEQPTLVHSFETIYGGTSNPTPPRVEWVDESTYFFGRFWNSLMMWHTIVDGIMALYQTVVATQHGPFSPLFYKRVGKMIPPAFPGHGLAEYNRNTRIVLTDDFYPVFEEFFEALTQNPLEYLRPKNPSKELWNDPLGDEHQALINSLDNFEFPWSESDRDQSGIGADRFEKGISKPIRDRTKFFWGTYSSTTMPDAIKCYRHAVVGTVKIQDSFEYENEKVQDYDRLMWPQGAVTGLRERLLDGMGLSKYKNDRPQDFIATGCITIIGRASQMRVIINEADFVAALRLRMGPNVCVEVVLFENFSTAQQIEIDQKTIVLVGMHGSGLTHAAFMRPKISSIVELLPYKVVCRHAYRDLSHVVGVNYFSWQNMDESKTRYPQKYESDRERCVDIPAEDVCGTCWTFYVYQDTIVDVPAVVDVIEKAYKTAVSNAEQ